MTIDNQFIKEHTRLVRTIAYQYDFPPMTHHDLMQEGYMGLIEAAKHYDPSTNLAQRLQITLNAVDLLRNHALRNLRQALVVPKGRLVGL